MQPPPPMAQPPSPYGPPGPGPYPHPYAPPVHAYHPPPAYYAMPNQVLANVELASPGSRLLAKIVDNLVMWLPFAIPVAAGAMNASENVVGATAAVAMLLMLAVGIFQIVLISTRGTTIGKKMLGLKMIKHDGGEVGFVHGFLLRSFVYTLIETFANLLFFYIPALVDSLMIFTDNHQTLHDRIASTYVIVDRG
jgi:uncharacterized RDD family membrane protein YckC